MTTRTEVITELKSVIKTDRNNWSDDAFERAIDKGLRALADSRPITGCDTLQLKSSCRQYPAPDCLIDYVSSDWGSWTLPVWEQNHPGALPRIYAANSLALGRVIEFSVPPSSRQLQVWGSEFQYYYKSRHVLTDEDNTLRPDDHSLFITRCLAALVLDLVTRNVVTPIQMNKGMSNMPNSATPARAYEILMNEYRAGL